MSINAYLNGLKNIPPHTLDAVLSNLGVSEADRGTAYAVLYHDQREDTREELAASSLPHIPNEDIAEGRWINTIGVQGRITDAQMDSVGIAETKRVVVVVDGRMYALDPDGHVDVYKMPAEPQA